MKDSPVARAVPKAGFKLPKQLLFALTLNLVITACYQAPPTTESAMQEIGSAGGTLTLPGSISATVEPNFLASPTQVSLSVSDTPAAYPPEVAASYGGGAPVAQSVTLTLPAASLATAGDLELQPNVSIRIPASVPVVDSESAERLLAEVHLFLSDGQHLFFFEPYARTEGETGQTAEGSDTVTLRLGQLRALGQVTSDTVRITVRPVRLGDEGLTTQALPEGFVREDIVGGLNGGVGFDFAPDGRIFIAEKGGAVRVVQNGQLRSQAFINLSREVNNTNDRGMLGIAVHPQFPQQPYIYVLYTYDPPEVQSGSGLAGPDGGGARVARLLRLTADAGQGYNVAVPGSEVVLLGKNSTYATIGNAAARNSSTPSCGPVGAYVQDCLPADELSHTIGTVRFGKDGSLFVGNGDGANYNSVQSYAVRALDPNSLSGKILRINPMTGAGYSNNPFYDGNVGSNRSKVYASGLRNPFRFTIQPGSGEPFIGDVGWGTWEEVNTGRGKNFGWPCYEGGSGSNLQQGGYRALNDCVTLYNSSTATAALYAYNHGGGGSSIQMGDFYSGTRYPEAYRGALFFSDINQGWIKYLKLNSNGTLASINDFLTNVSGITQITTGPQGDLYLMDIYANKLTRLRYTAPTTTPLVASASADTLQGAAPLLVTFSSAGSSGTGTLRYSWTFGDGATSAESNPSHTFAEPGVYKVNLTVSDDTGDSTAASLTVRANNTPPTATILSPANGSKYNVGDLIAFSGSATDPEQGDLTGTSLTWSVELHHNEHVHLDILPPTTGAEGSFIAEDHSDSTYLELCLKATDAFGEDATSCVNLYPNKASYTLDTVPSGLELPWEGVSRKTPFTVETNVNAQQQLVAPAQQGTYTFSGWSDGGAATHTIKIGTAPTRLVATYKSSTPVPSYSASAVCRNRYLLENRTNQKVKFSWRWSSVTYSETLKSNKSETIRFNAMGQNLTFYAGNQLVATVAPSKQTCR